MSERNISPQRRYELKAIRRYTLKLNRGHDEDILAFLEGQENVNGLLKSLLRKEMKRLERKAAKLGVK